MSFCAVGTLTHDVKLEHKDGFSFARFKVEIGKDKVIECECWERTAEKLVKGFQKGSMVLIEGPVFMKNARVDFGNFLYADSCEDEFEEEEEEGV